MALDPVNRLRFGTAGVRAEVGLGYNRLNVLSVIAVAQGVLKVLEAEGRVQRVIVGYDARVDSEKFAVVIGAVFKSKGIELCLFSKHVPTPFVAYGVLLKSADVGFCVTASHNPAKDNGVKVFWRDGVQVRPDIAEKVEAAAKENSKPWMEYALERSGLGEGVFDPLEEVKKEYYPAIMNAVARRSKIENAGMEGVVYTACHGVGWEYVDPMFEAFGLPRVVPCKEQCEPDPKFPTLPFPNPEEKGALDLAVKTAKEKGLRLVLANDPDADRFGAAEIGKEGDVKVFTGNEIALLLADYLSGERENEHMENYAVVASTVSSRIIASMGKKRGFVFREALTGFKWLNKEAIDMEESGKTVLLTYEEALGYNITRNIVRDKDGVSAAAVFAEMAGAIYRSEGTLAKRLDELLDECGVHLSKNGYLKTSTASATVKQIFEGARERGLPTQLGQAFVRSVRDVTYGTDSGNEDGKSQLSGDTQNQFLTFRCSRDNSDEADYPLVIHLRNSGTGKSLSHICSTFESTFLANLSWRDRILVNAFSDLSSCHPAHPLFLISSEPKIKYYSELRCSREEAEDGSGMAFLESALHAVINQVLRPKENGLKEQ